jgi:hypothetical protein
MSMPLKLQSTEPNKALVRRYFEEILNKRNLVLVGEIFSGDSIFRASEYPDTLERLHADGH